MKAALCILSLGLGLSGPAQILTTGDFEAGGTEPFAIQGAAADSLTVVGSPVRAGRHAGRSLLRASDAKVSKGLRAEFVDHTPVPLGRVHWYGLSIHTGLDFTAPASVDGILFQFHQHAKTGSPVLAFRVIGTSWRITADTGGQRRTLAVLPFASGRWTDWVVRVKWTNDATGDLTIWKDGEQVVREINLATTYAAETAGPYAKFGQYHTVADTAQNVVCFDEYRLAGPASGYDDVTPANKNAAEKSAALK
jgi:hypothetical protein